MCIIYIYTQLLCLIIIVLQNKGSDTDKEVMMRNKSTMRTAEGSAGQGGRGGTRR